MLLYSKKDRSVCFVGQLRHLVSVCFPLVRGPVFFSPERKYIGCNALQQSLQTAAFVNGFVL